VAVLGDVRRVLDRRLVVAEGDPVAGELGVLHRHEGLVGAEQPGAHRGPPGLVGVVVVVDLATAEHQRFKPLSPDYIARVHRELDDDRHAPSGWARPTTPSRSRTSSRGWSTAPATSSAVRVRQLLDEAAEWLGGPPQCRLAMRLGESPGCRDLAWRIATSSLGSGQLYGATTTAPSQLHPSGHGGGASAVAT